MVKRNFSNKNIIEESSLDIDRYSRKILNKRLLFAEENIIFLVLITVFIIMAIISPQFRTLYNIYAFLISSSLIAIVAMGQGIVLITGNFDLSVGHIACLVGTFTGYIIVILGMPVWVGIICGALLGIMCGLFNGILVAYANINALIATLASGWVFGGIVLVATKGWAIVGYPDAFIKIARGNVLTVPNLIIIVIVITVILTILLSLTYWGRYIYATGGNDQAAILSGINTKFIKLASFCISGFFAAIAGILLTARLATATADGGTDWALPSVAAAVIGGCAIGGGKGKIHGVLFGAIIFSLINNVLVLSRVSPYWQGLVTGFILILAVLIDALRKK